MTGVEMIKKLKGLGFTVIKVSKGSHYHMTNGGAYVIVPHQMAAPMSSCLTTTRNWARDCIIRYWKTQN